MQDILQGLFELEGVRGSFVFSQAGKIILSKAHAIYDDALLNEVSRSVVKAIDSLILHHPDWEETTAHFAEGKLLIRNLGGKALLGVIADGSLNPSFANVAIRVAVGKLKAKIASGGLEEQSATAVSQSQPAARSAVSSSGLSWSGMGSSQVGSNISVADKASSAFLTSCASALAKSVGPMAKVFVKEAVRKVVPNGPFSRDHIPQLLTQLESHISDPEERAEFRRRLLVG
jgi:predicted regulator of Ras-like GTPase activity (Roadblock/LC7/MglB family)